MKNNILLVTVALILSGNAMAQRTGPSMNDRQMTRLKTELSLSDEQVERIREMNKTFWQEHSRMRSDTTLTREAMMRKRKALTETRQSGMKRILTKEQYKKWLAMKPAETRRPSHGVRKTSVERLKEEAGLSDEQAKKIGSINSAMAQRFQKLRMDTSMTRDNRVQAQRHIMDERNAEIKKVLTPEQYEKFTALEKERMARRRQPGPRK